MNYGNRATDTMPIPTSLVRDAVHPNRLGDKLTPVKQPSMQVSVERLHTALARVSESIITLENHLAPLLVSVPERPEKDSNECTGITLVDMLDDAVRRAYALSQRIDDIGQRAAV